MKKLFILLIVLSFSLFVKSQIFLSREQILSEFKDNITYVYEDAIEYKKDNFKCVCFIDKNLDKCTYYAQQSIDSLSVDYLIDYLDSNKKYTRYYPKKQDTKCYSIYWKYRFKDEYNNEIVFTISILKPDAENIFPIIQYKFMTID